jgi:glycosyltransferase involved in cell wall biosynthesis
LPLLRGHIDGPTPDDRVHVPGFTVRGWCAWGDRPALAVAICLDGVTVGRTAVGSVPRPDVVDALHNEHLLGTGWRVPVGLGTHRRGEAAELSVLVWGDATAPPAVLGRFTVVVGADSATDTTAHSGTPSPEYVGALDAPRPGARVAAAFPVRGWALRQRRAVDRIDVLVDGVPAGSARLGLPRVDLDVQWAGPDALISGFECWVDLSSSSSWSSWSDPMSGPSTVTVQLVAGTSDGTGVPVFERVIKVRPDDPLTERSDREIERARRRTHLLSAISAPRSPDLNLVVFTHQLDYGGGQLWLEDFLRESGAGSRFACTVISFKDGPLRDLAEQRGITVHVTDAPPVDDFGRYEDRVTELAAFVAGGGHNLALVNTAPVFSGADVALRLSLPTIWAIHESFTPRVLMSVAFSSEIQPQVLAAARHAMATADALVFEAAATLDLYAGWGRPGHSIVIPYGVDTRAILDDARSGSRRDARSKVGVRPDSRLVLVMGTVEPRKAQTRIARAFASVAADHPDWSLVFVGDTNSHYSEVLKQYVGTLDLGDRCSVVPVDSDAYRWYRAADVLLSASDVESLPRSMLEAMCFGITVVSASVFGVPELVTDGKTGFLFEPNDLDALESTLHRVLGLNDDELERVGQAGRDHVLEHHDSAGYAGELLRLCHGLLQDRGATPHEVLSKQSQRFDALGLEAAR